VAHSADGLVIVSGYAKRTVGTENVEQGLLQCVQVLILIQETMGLGDDFANELSLVASQPKQNSGLESSLL
jgi:hypothetical protein